MAGGALHDIEQETGAGGERRVRSRDAMIGGADSSSRTWMVVSSRLAIGESVQSAGAMASRSELVRQVSKVSADWHCKARRGWGSR